MVTTPEDMLDQTIIPRASKVLVGVSGGLDSIALLHLLNRIKHNLAIEIIVVHYDHALRPGSSKDAHFVSRIAAELGFVFITEKNHKKCAKGISTEEFAREQRFDFFFRVAGRLSADAVILAHTQDDLAETVLMRIIRGTGLSGLRSILPAREINGVLFLRPLLNTRRSALEKFMVQIKAKHIEDPSNRQDIFLRNKIRHALIPYISRNFTPAITEKLAELAVNAAIDYDVLAEELNQIWPKVVVQSRGKVQIQLSEWKMLPRSMRRMLLREAAKRIAGGQGGLSLKHVSLIEVLAEQTGSTHKISCGADLKIMINKKFISLS